MVSETAFWLASKLLLRLTIYILLTTKAKEPLKASERVSRILKKEGRSHKNIPQNPQMDDLLLPPRRKYNGGAHSRVKPVIFRRQTTTKQQAQPTNHNQRYADGPLCAQRMSNHK